MYKIKSQLGLVNRPERIGDTLVGLKTDVSAYGYYRVVGVPPESPSPDQQYVDSGKGTYDESAMTYTPDWVLEDIPPEPVPDYGTQMSRLQFEKRFTDDEWVAIDLASIGATPEAAGVRRVLRLVSQAEFIDLSLPEIKDGLDKLVALVPEFTQARADEIRTTPLTEKEQWNG